jgi:hypothetical protein
MIGRKLTPEDLEVQACVYKLFCGDRYLIVKGKTLAGSIYLIERGYAAFIAAGGGTGNRMGGIGQKEWDGTNTYYMKFYQFVRHNPTLPIRHEVLLESDNVYILLKTEQLALDEAFSDKKCLNNNITSYIPIWRKKSMSYGWMNRGSVLAFKKYLKRK